MGAPERSVAYLSEASDYRHKHRDIQQIAE